MTQHIFVPEKGKGQPIACPTHISIQANSYPTWWQMYHTAGYLQAVLEDNGKTHTMDYLQVLSQPLLLK